MNDGIKSMARFLKLNARQEEMAMDASWQSGCCMFQDKQTGLYWEAKSPNAEDFNFLDRKLNHYAFYETYIHALNSSRFGGFDDWRVPLQAELRTLADYHCIAPAFERSLSNFLVAGEYWCGPPAGGMRSDSGWILNFNLGAATLRHKDLFAHGLAVRGECRFKRQERFCDNGDGTVLDCATGLMWQKAQNERRSYLEVQEMLKGFELAGYRDWRLPSMKELSTIFDESYAGDSWYYQAFFDCERLKPPILQHITSDLFEGTYVWVKNFHFGYDGYYAEQSMPLCWRLVRDTDKPRRVFQLPESGQRPAFITSGTGRRKTGSGRFQFTRTKDYILDENTGLYYELKSDIVSEKTYKNRLFHFTEALSYVEWLNAVRYAGYADWRLPTCDELRMIVSYAGESPAVASDFKEFIAADFYWTGEIHPVHKAAAWAMYMGYGCAVPLEQRRCYRVLAVRGGHCSLSDKSFRRYLVDEETVTDTYLGRMWLRAELPPLAAWEVEAYLSEQKPAGFEDWRLPEMKELSTLVRRDCPGNSWFDTDLFPDVNKATGNFFLAAETFNGLFHWGVNIRLGYDGYYADRLSGKYRIKPVRNL